MSDDAVMRRLAARRSRVLVDLPNGDIKPAKLVAWRPRGGRSRARVLYSTGRERSVDVSQVSAPTSSFRSIAGQWERRYGTDRWWPVPADEVPDLDDGFSQ